jgi:hypothetical protein
MPSQSAPIARRVAEDSAASDDGSHRTLLEYTSAGQVPTISSPEPVARRAERSYAATQEDAEQAVLDLTPRPFRKASASSATKTILYQPFQNIRSSFKGRNFRLRRQPIQQDYGFNKLKYIDRMPIRCFNMNYKDIYLLI